MSHIETLRSQYDGRKGCWKIVKKSDNINGGWRRFGTTWYADKQWADEAVERIIRNNPGQYQLG